MKILKDLGIVEINLMEVEQVLLESGRLSIEEDNEKKSELKIFDVCPEFSTARRRCSLNTWSLNSPVNKPNRPFHHQLSLRLPNSARSAIGGRWKQQQQANNRVERPLLHRQSTGISINDDNTLDAIDDELSQHNNSDLERLDADQHSRNLSNDVLYEEESVFEDPPPD